MGGACSVSSRGGRLGAPWGLSHGTNPTWGLRPPTPSHWDVNLGSCQPSVSRHPRGNESVPLLSKSLFAKGSTSQSVKTHTLKWHVLTL